MRLLLISPKNPIPTSTSQISTFTSAWVYYLQRELRKFSEISIITLLPEELTCDKLDEININSYDGVLGLGLRYFSLVDPTVMQYLHTASTVVSQLYDGSRLDADAGILTFTVRDDAWRYEDNPDRTDRHNRHNVTVGWAADPELIVPAQEPNRLRIFVDHASFSFMTPDRTLDVLANIQQLVKSKIWMTQFDEVVVRYLVSGQIIDVDLSKPIMVEQYDRKGVPFEELCGEYAKTDIFCVTHYESVGLSVIEAATAGALVLSPIGCINKDRLSTINHVEWDRVINWEQVIDSLDPVQCRARAMQNSWQQIASRIFTGIQQRKYANE